VRSRVPVVMNQDESMDEHNDVVNDMFGQSRQRKKKAPNVKTNKNFKEPAMNSQRNSGAAYMAHKDTS